jgi:hypothetical protein
MGSGPQSGQQLDFTMSNYFELAFGMPFRIRGNIPPPPFGGYNVYGGQIGLIRTRERRISGEGGILIIFLILISYCTARTPKNLPSKDRILFLSR